MISNNLALDYVDCIKYYGHNITLQEGKPFFPLLNPALHTPAVKTNLITENLLLNTNRCIEVLLVLSLGHRIILPRPRSRGHSRSLHGHAQ